MNLTSFFQENGKLILIGLVGVVLGVIGNSLLRSYENKNFLVSLNSELNKLEEKAKNSTLNADEQKQMDNLKSEIYIMKFKCQA